ncbi:MAG: J domain-containing protein [Eubacterium sp.]|nr:J domain-containing protein [Eubacterium sp.]
MAKRDYYECLGVTKNADEKEIKRAYRKLAKKYHPDTNPGDQQAEQRFKEVTEAYNVLSDTEKRKLYDRFGMAAFDGSMGDPFGGDPSGGADGSGGYSGGFGNGGQYREYHYSTGNMDDIFGDIFGDMFRGSGFRDGFSGREEDPFDGFGSSFGGGFGGQAQYDHEEGKNVHSDVTIDFEEAAFGCDKYLRFEGDKKESLQVHIPAGINEGQSVRLKGKGETGRYGKQAGDLLLKVHIRPHPEYTRKGNDVYITQAIPYTTAVLGGKAYFKTLHGMVECNVPAGTQSGSKIRLKHKGIVSMKDPTKHGDEYVVIQIAVPKNPTPEQRRALEALAETEGKSA